jgi:hypothetical protein
MFLPIILFWPTVTCFSVAAVVHATLIPFCSWLELQTGAESTLQYMSRDEVAVIITSLARSISLLIVCIPHAWNFFYQFMLHAQIDETLASILVGTWGTVVIWHEVGTYLLTGHDVVWRRSAVFMGFIFYCTMNTTVLVGGAAILAFGNVLRGIDYAWYAVQVMFPNPPAEYSVKWARFTHRMDQVDGYIKGVHMFEMAALSLLLIQIVWYAHINTLC